MKNKIKNFAIQMTKECSKLGTTVMVNVSVSKYDFYFDSIYECVSKNGINCNLVFFALKDGLPIDCHVKIQDLDGKNVIFEQLVKKKDFPEELTSSNVFFHFFESVFYLIFLFIYFFLFILLFLI